MYKSHLLMGLCVGKAGNAGVLGPVPEGKESVKALVRYKAGQVGLQNLGNTCFLNSAVQCLSHTQPLTEYFLENDWKSEVNADNPLGMGGRIAEGYGALIDRMWRGTKTTVNPEDFKGVVEQWAPQFQGYEQHDSSELLTFLLDGLHEDLNRVTVKKYVQDAECDGLPEEVVAAQNWRNYLIRNKSIVVDLFQGQLRSSLTCTSCKYNRIKFDPFMYLSLPIPKKKEGTPLTLDDCLSEFLIEEDLVEDNKWYCPKCRAFRDAKKKFDLWKVPPILFVSLKRFEYKSNGTRRKIDCQVDFPVQADWKLKGRVLSPQTQEPRYALYGVSNHGGDLGQGHYTAYCKNQEDQQWYHYDDSQFEQVQNTEVAVRGGKAYVLMFQQIVDANKSV